MHLALCNGFVSSAFSICIWSGGEKGGRGFKVTRLYHRRFECLEGCLWDIGRVFIAGMMIVASSPVMR
jgi:hypothetical protein